MSEFPACHYGEVDQSAHVKTISNGKLLSTAQGFGFDKHLLYFFFVLFCFVFIFNCTMQQPRLVVQYSVIVERKLA